MTVTTLARSITGGVDTHLDFHVAAALDERGTLLGVESLRDISNEEGRTLLRVVRRARVSLDTYSHVMPGMQAEAAAAVAGLVFGHG
jgi:hypothetical protein